ncbi:MAG: hypothetical protein J6Y94_06735, partial [Bacteriovoracaceae bacterium]|nr:hypothetical protein [Bacteriovoracaceae bacterium]
GDHGHLAELTQVKRQVVAGGLVSAKFIIGWCILAEFILFLALSLHCYPLLPGGLLAIEAISLGLFSPTKLFMETSQNLPVILLVIFIVSAVTLLKDFLSYVFSGILVKVKSKLGLSLAFCAASAFLSAFLDALTVTAVFILVLKTAYEVFQKYEREHPEISPVENENFKAFLRSLIMHAAVGTALGGVLTVVGEPQNLLIAKLAQQNLAAFPAMQADWDFIGFIRHMSPITFPCLGMGLITTIIAEKFHLFGHGTPMPEAVRTALRLDYERQQACRTSEGVWRLRIQGLAIVLLIIGLALHVAEVGFIGLGLLIFLTSCLGMGEEHRIGACFQETMPFCALLVVFFGIVAMIDMQGLFYPIISHIFKLAHHVQLYAMFIANGILSAISDNVFVATAFMNEISNAFKMNLFDPKHFEHLAIVVNVGTNIPSVATPNGQAAFLFLLTSSFAPLIGLNYQRMFVMALPYTIILIITAVTAIGITFI